MYHKENYLCPVKQKNNKEMNYLQSVELANKEHERGLRLLENGRLSEYVESYKLVTELNRNAELLKKQ